MISFQRLGTNESHLGQNYDLSSRVIGNARMTHANSDRWHYGESEFNAVKARKSTGWLEVAFCDKFVFASSIPWLEQSWMCRPPPSMGYAMMEGGSRLYHYISSTYLTPGLNSPAKLQHPLQIHFKVVGTGLSRICKPKFVRALIDL